jgi:uncharacterized protein YbaA (DUF1428 family)
MKKMDYVDLFALPLPRKNLAKYRRTAQTFARVIKEFGAVEYREFVGDDLHPKGMTPFTKNIKLKRGEVLVGAYLVYHSRALRDRANKKMMADPRMKKMMEEMSKKPLFDVKRMLYGGFKTIVRM